MDTYKEKFINRNVHKYNYSKHKREKGNKGEGYMYKHPQLYKTTQGHTTAPQYTCINCQ